MTIRVFFFQAEDGIRDRSPSRGLGDVYKRQGINAEYMGRLMEESKYISAYKMVHGSEPEKTFPTGLIAPFMDTDPEGTFDYIWYKGKDIEPVTTKIFGDQCLPGDNTIYPSDHCGIVCEFKIK
eukprot:TRINITY_DN7849_c0_g1_i3.p2 TRINITY_DN7849_c0_g1~~TRINITY_DN7849_c0_g1_i3.p2  ORF type:complete len:124 (-),score=40.63 TRINITY_DN7849_c0_g1_i3:129-500(-)